MTPTIVSEDIIEVARLECEGTTYSRARVVVVWSNGARYLERIHYLIGDNSMKRIGGERSEMIESPAIC